MFLGDIQKAIAAIEVSRRKNAKSLAWSWAEIAGDHAFAAGINNIELGAGRYPDLDKLENNLRSLQKRIARSRPRSSEAEAANIRRKNDG